jgi:hypothetical protein
MPIARYAITALLAVVAITGVLLLVRPFIFSWSAARDDANYPLVSISVADAGPRLVELVLNDQHGLPGEVPDGEHARLMVVVAPDPRGGYTAVAAWSTTHDCAVTLADDRLADCAGDTWIYAGIPISAAKPLVAVPITVRNGAVIADFTRPMDPGA